MEWKNIAQNLLLEDIYLDIKELKNIAIKTFEKIKGTSTQLPRLIEIMDDTEKIQKLRIKN